MKKEFYRIEKFFSPLAGAGSHNLKDDTALLRPYLISTDTMVEGTHFLPTDKPENLAKKLLAVNLSDLASKGAYPYGYTLNLTLPHDTQDDWFKDFTQGLLVMQKTYTLKLLGGDTTHYQAGAEGGTIVSATLFGGAPAYLPLRGNAKVGDVVCVTGALGAGAFGLLACRGYIKNKELEQYYQCPTPHTQQGIILNTYANAMIDISDGLIADLNNIAKTSNVNITIVYDDVPIHHAVKLHKNAVKDADELIFAGGDDYILALTIPKEQVKTAQTALSSIGKTLHVIGTVKKGQGVVVLNSYGETIHFKNSGYQHA